MTDDTIRIGFIGAGDNTRSRHIPGFQAIDGVELVSVCNRSRESSQRVADQFGIPLVYDNWVDLVEDDNTDAICIGTWPYMHCTMTLAGLENGKHVLTEARMAMNSAEARTMLEASMMEPDLVTQIVPAPHTLPVDSTIKELIADGYLGELLSVDMTSQSGFIDYDGPLHWRHDRDLSGFNTMGMGISYESLLRWVGPACWCHGNHEGQRQVQEGRVRTGPVHHGPGPRGDHLRDGVGAGGAHQDQHGDGAGPAG